MATIRFRVTGTSPLLMNNPAKMGGGNEAGSVGVKKAIPTPEQEAAGSAYKLPSGQLFLKTEALRASLIDGGTGRQFVPKGAKRGTSATKLVQSTVFVLDEAAPLVDPDTREPLTAYETDVRRVVVQGNGVMRARAKVLKWQTQVEFEYDPDFLQPAHIAEIFGLAGHIVGVGDYRPHPPKTMKAGKGGPYGRYTVELLED